MSGNQAIIRSRSANNPNEVFFRVPGATRATHVPSAGVMIPDEMYVALSQRAKNKGAAATVLVPTLDEQSPVPSFCIGAGAVVVEDRSVLDDGSKVTTGDERWSHLSLLARAWVNGYLTLARKWWEDPKALLTYLGLREVVCPTMRHAALQWRGAAENGNTIIFCPTDEAGISNLAETLQEDFRDGMWPGGEEQYILFPTIPNGFGQTLIASRLVEGLNY